MPAAAARLGPDAPFPKATHDNKTSEQRMARLWLTIGASGGAMTVLLGAFGAHAVRGHVAESLLATWETATSYLGMHSMALLVCGLLLRHQPDLRSIAGAAWGFLLGSVLFSGSLFLLVLSDERSWGVITPFGGLTLIAAWCMLAVGAWQSGGRKEASNREGRRTAGR